MKMDFSQIGPILIGVAVVLLIYRRFRRSFGRQPLQPVRMRARIAIFLIIGCLMLPVATRSMASASAMLAGVAAGVALALWGAARTRYLKIADQLHYVPHTYTGIAISALFLGRLIFRFIQVYGNATGQALATTPMAQSPLTIGLFFALIGYYACYYAAVLWRSKQNMAQQTADSTPLLDD
jgi:uncharacterized membrane protein